MNTFAGRYHLSEHVCNIFKIQDQKEVAVPWQFHGSWKLSGRCSTASLSTYLQIIANNLGYYLESFFFFIITIFMRRSCKI